MHLRANTAYAAWDHTVEFEGGVCVRLLPPTEAALRDAPPGSRAELIDAAKGLVPDGARAVMAGQSAAALVQLIQLYETLAAEWRAAQARAIAGAAAAERQFTAEARRARRKTGDGAATTLDSWRTQVGARGARGADIGQRTADSGQQDSRQRDNAENPPALKLARELAGAAASSGAA